MPDHDPGQLTSRQLDRYASQLARCLKALGTDAPIRADVQRELATVRAEQESRASPGPDVGDVQQRVGRRLGPAM
jgi:hypothetical protein